MTINSALADYGISDFKGRELDTAFTTVTLRLKNRILGDYQDACFVFGHIIDAEFGMNREPIVAPCDHEDAIKRWELGHQFQSRWIVSG